MLMTAIKIKKFYKKTGRRPRVDGKMHVAFDKRKVECFNCHNTGHFARECKFKGSKEGSRQEAGRSQDFKPVRTEKEALMTIDEDTYNALQAKYDELQSEFGDQEAALVAHKLAVKKLESQLKEDIADLLYEYGKIWSQLQSPSPTVSETSSTVYSTCPSNDSDGEQGTVSDQTVNANPSHDHTPIPSIEQVTMHLKRLQHKCLKPNKQLTPSCALALNLSHLIKDCDYYEKKMAREAAFKGTRVVHANARQATPAWTNSNRIKTGRVNVNTGHGNVSSVSSAGTQFKSGASRVNTGKQHVNSGRMEYRIQSNIYAVRAKWALCFDSAESTRQTQAVKALGSQENLFFFVVLGSSTEAYWSIEGIKQEFSNQDLLSKMGLAERYEDGHLIAGMLGTMLADSHLLHFFGQEAVNTACYTSTGFILEATSKAAISEKIATKKTHSSKQSSSTPISKSTEDIMTFRTELDALALKHLGPVPATAPTSNNSVNTGSINLHTAFEEVNTGNTVAISPSADHEEEAYYVDDGIITDFNNLPDEVDVSTNHTLRIHNAHPQSQILGDPNTHVQTRSSLKKITEAHALVSYMQAQQRSNHKDQQHCLLLAFYLNPNKEKSQNEKALEDES
ncbi:putative ribonuclease H-like domain-containing protein [Tanacetum coccineum]